MIRILLEQHVSSISKNLNFMWQRSKFPSLGILLNLAIPNLLQIQETSFWILLIPWDQAARLVFPRLPLCSCLPPIIYIFMFDFIRNFAFLCLFLIDQWPIHQSNSLEHSSISVSIPSLIDSFIPGTDNKCNVSAMALQSSSETSTALSRFPVITMGWCVDMVSSIRL